MTRTTTPPAPALRVDASDREKALRSHRRVSANPFALDPIAYGCPFAAPATWQALMTMAASPEQREATAPARIVA
jgi:hypothetical protein